MGLEVTQDLGRRVCLGPWQGVCGGTWERSLRPPESGLANMPHCFHSYEMWEVWTRLPYPSGGHERSVCKV